MGGTATTHVEGLAHQAAGRYEDALLAYNRALKAEPYEAIFMSKKLVLRKLERYASAVAACNKALSLSPKNVVALNNKGVSLIALGGNTKKLSNASIRQVRSLEICSCFWKQGGCFESCWKRR
jgi:Flp pilus assembly protein TadD